MSWDWEPVWLDGLFKLSGPRGKYPVVHTFDVIVKYKDGTEKKEAILDGFRKKKNARQYAEEVVEGRANGSESDEIKNVTYKLRNVYIHDWL